MFSPPLRALFTNRSKHHLLLFISFYFQALHGLPLEAQNKSALPNRFPDPKFEHIDVKDGLPENSVHCILQDHFGFLWLGTQNGLVRYDGYSMTVYQPGPDNPKSIADNRIRAICEDHAGTLWVGTYLGGLNKFDRSNGTFTRYLTNPMDSTSIGSNNVSCIYEDNAGRLWVGCEGGGLCLMDRKSNKFSRYYFQDSAYDPGVYQYLSGQGKRGRQISSIVKVGNNADSTKNFTLRKKTEILLVVMGEDGADYGWLENDHGINIARYDSNRTCFAGGRSDNRVQMSLITLNAGRYRIRYKSDESHSYNKWLGNAPLHPEYWGIQVFDISREAERIRQMLDTLQPTNTATSVRAVMEDQQTGNLSVGTGRPGLWTFDLHRKVFSKSDLPSADHIISRGRIQAFLRARDGALWIASTFGLSRYDSRTDNFKSYQVIPSAKSVPENNFGSLLEDPTGLIWVGYYGLGLEIFDPQTEQFRCNTSVFNNQQSLLASSSVTSLYEDRSGILWVGTWLAGLDKWDRKKRRFVAAENGPGVLAQGDHSPLFEDRAGEILAGTDEGIVRLNSGEKSRSRYPYPYSADKNHKKNRISGILQDPIERGVLWISSLDSGLIRFDSEKGLSTRYQHDSRDMNSLSTNEVQKILFDHAGVLWVGTQMGLNKFDRTTGRFARFNHVPNDSTSLSENDILSMYEDRSGTLWVGTNAEGLNRFDRITGKFHTYRSLVAGKEVSTIVTIYEDRHGNFWIGEYVTGLHLFDRDKGRSVHNFTEKDGLANNTVVQILEDGSGTLWISTRNGLSRFNFQARTFKNYYVEDGLPDNFLWRSGLKTRDERIILGGRKGPTVFHPDSIKDDPVPPQVVITNVSIFNRPEERLAVHEYIPELKELGLSHKQNDLRFDFVALQFSEPSRNRYKYILENFDQDWVDAGTQRNATYTNLDPGEYTFKVNAANRDGISNQQGASIRIVITPPWWKTIWVYCAYVLLTASILYSIYRVRINRLRLSHQLQLEHLEAEKMHEVDRMKSRFFANISHEFRTPLTLISGPIEEMLAAEKEEKKRQHLSMMQRNTQRLLRLINQLLDLSKLEAGAMKLRAGWMNIVPLVKGIAYSFESSAGMRGVTLNVNVDQEEIEVYCDKDMVEKILTNLLSNAFKFTPEDGSVTCTLRRNRTPTDKMTTEVVEIIVSDTGIGIPSDQLGRVFDRFYQVDASQTREHEGSGIGLALANELVELHHGTIQVQSEVGRGTTFTVRLPLGRRPLKDDEIIDVPASAEPTPHEVYLADADKPIEGVKEETESERAKGERPIILVVEDNADVRAYIKDYLVSGFQVAEARDGAEGIEKALEIIPDLIISDVMMPKKDGYEVCRTLKLDEKTSHIPTILLTAKAASENKIEGLEIGADDYLIKPFEPKELLARVKNLIEIRRKLRERFGTALRPGEITVTSIDDAFLQRAMTVVERHIGDENFSIDDFGYEVGMSRAQLHRKLIALTNQSASEFVRYLRLQRAMDLLKKNAGTVAEVAYSVGFSNASNFAKWFQKLFGMAPSEVRKRAHGAA